MFLISFHAAKLFPAGDFPKTDLPVFTAGRQNFAVRREGQRAVVQVPPAQKMQLLARGRIPHVNISGIPPQRQQSPVRRKAHAHVHHLIFRTPLQSAELLPRSYFSDIEIPILKTAQRYQPSVGRNFKRKDERKLAKSVGRKIIVLAQQLPGPDFPQLAAVGCQRQQSLAVPGKQQLARTDFRAQRPRSSPCRLVGPSRPHAAQCSGQHQHRSR